MHNVVIISDTQIPFHDLKATKNLVAFIHQWRPDEVIHIGDLMDYPQPSRWTAGTRGVEGQARRRHAGSGRSAAVLRWWLCG